MSHECTICYNDFAWDPSAKDKSRLPVQSRVCSHVLCYSCVLSIYQASDGPDGAMLSCPDCRLSGAHDPLAPIISLPICELLAERHQMVEYDPDLKPVEEEIKRQSVVKRDSRPRNLHTSASDLFVEVVQERANQLRKSVAEKITVEKPLLRFTREASRAFYWGSILVFGTIDRNETATMQQESVEKVWNKVAEKLEDPLDIRVNLDDVSLNFSV